MDAHQMAGRSTASGDAPGETLAHLVSYQTRRICAP